MGTLAFSVFYSYYWEEMLIPENSTLYVSHDVPLPEEFLANFFHSFPSKTDD
jgi:hypothetical protein